MPMRLVRLLILLAVTALPLVQPPACSQFSPGGQLPTLANSRLAQRITALCNDACASFASGVTYDALWSAEHPTAASLAQAPESPCP